MMIGLAGGIDAGVAGYGAGQAFGGVGKGGLITIIVVSVIAIAAFVWIFRETGRRD